MTRDRDPKNVKQRGETHEGGATAGKTHEEVLDQVVGRERRLQTHRPAESDETGT